MKEKVKKEKKQINYYKIATFVLVGVLVLVGLGFGFMKITEGSYNKGIVFGQENAINLILSEISNTGYATINLPENNSVVLVSSNAIAVGQEKLLEDVVGTIAENGFVTLTLPENQSLTLVPYQPQVQSQN